MAYTHQHTSVTLQGMPKAKNNPKLKLRDLANYNVAVLVNFFFGPSFVTNVSHKSKMKRTGETGEDGCKRLLWIPQLDFSVSLKLPSFSKFVTWASAVV